MEKNPDLKVSPSIYFPTLNSKARTIVHQGGQWSGKTVNILAVLATKATQTPNLTITVTSESMPHLKIGALRDFINFIYPSFESFISQYNRTDHIFIFRNGSIIEFKSFEDEYKARGAKRHILFINEANKFNYLTYFQLNSRTEIQTILDYNPTQPFFVHEKLIGQEGVELFISDHRSNPFLSEAKHAEIEAIKDYQLWLVYARGMTGNITGLIFPDWTKIPDSQFPKDEPFFGGLDFGYTNDPTAGVKIVRMGESLYIHELCYTPGIAPIQMKQIFLSNGFTNGIPIYCEHDPDNISQLRRLGLMAMPARKGAGSINAGIVKLKEFKVFYTASSVNLDEERRRYVWMTDPKDGSNTNTPIDQWNHLFDAVRYGVYTQYFR